MNRGRYYGTHATPARSSVRTVEEVQARPRPRPRRISVTRRLHLGDDVRALNPGAPVGYVQVAERFQRCHGGVVHFHYLRADLFLGSAQ